MKVKKNNYLLFKVNRQQMTSAAESENARIKIIFLSEENICLPTHFIELYDPRDHEN